RPAASIPRRLEVARRQPLEWIDQTLNRGRHERNVEIRELIIRLMIRRRRSPTCCGVRHHSLQRERIVVRALEEVLLRIRIRSEQRTVCLERGSKIRSLPSCEQQRALRHLGILIADHLEFEIRNEAGERYGRMLTEICRAELADFLATVTDEQNAPSELRPCCKCVRKLHHRRRSGRVVVRSVVNRVALYRSSDSQMVQMRGKQNSSGRRIGTLQISNRVVRHAWFSLRRDVYRERRGRAVVFTCEPSGCSGREHDDIPCNCWLRAVLESHSYASMSTELRGHRVRRRTRRYQHDSCTSANQLCRRAHRFQWIAANENDRAFGLRLRQILGQNLHQRCGYGSAGSDEKMKIITFLQRHVADCERCITRQRRRYDFSALYVSRHSWRGLQPVGHELGRNIGCRDLFIASRASATVHRIARQKTLVRRHPLRSHDPRRFLLRYAA